MYRDLLISVLLISGASCVPVKTTYYEAVDRPRVASATNGNVIACPPIGGYGLGTIGAARLLVDAGYAEGRARVDLVVFVWALHQLTFKASEIQLTSLSDPTIRSFAPFTFYVDCKHAEPERYCPRVPPEVHTLGGPPNSSQITASFIGIADVPSEFVSGFIVTLPDIFEGTSRIDTKPLKFQRRTGVLLRGLGGCE